MSPGEVNPPCPACGEPLYGWVQIARGAGSQLLQRCESCGLGIAAGLEPDDVPRELLVAAATLPDGALEARMANRDSVQARLGGQHWAALDPGRGLYLTRRSLELLAEKAGLSVARTAFPAWGQSQVWMWQTIVNAFTFHENFAIRARAGLLRPLGPAARLKYLVDAAVTVLATPLILVVSLPLELIAALSGRGAVMVAILKRDPDRS